MAAKKSSVSNLAQQIEQLEIDSSTSQNADRIEIKLGRKFDWGFCTHLTEDIYYSLYSFFFYQNEWIERIFDTYHILDYQYGEDQVRINDDKFKFRNEYNLTKIGYISSETHFDNDFQLCVYTIPFKGNKNLIKFNLFSSDVQRKSVDEITLQYSDHFSIIFSKIVNLQNMSINYSATISINPFSKGVNNNNEAHSLLSLPNGTQILKTIFEMDVCLHICSNHPNKFHGMDNDLYTHITKISEDKLEKSKSDRSFSIIPLYENLYTKQN